MKQRHDVCSTNVQSLCSRPSHKRRLVANFFRGRRGPPPSCCCGTHLSWSDYITLAGGFFDSAVAQQMWRNHLSFMTSHVNPYTGVAMRDDPTIMARRRCSACCCDVVPTWRPSGFAACVLPKP